MEDEKIEKNREEKKENNEPAPASACRFEKRSLCFWVVASGGFFAVAVILAGALYLTAGGKLPFRPKNNPISVVNRPGESGAEMNGLVRRLIDGVYVEEGEENHFPLAVVIDNHPDARPAAGLAKANLVIEAPAEGASTRFLAFFADQSEIAEIGPVRSARPYFLDWTKEFSAAFFHCGGSPAALARIVSENINAVNEFYNGHIFWRSAKRGAPHNVMISAANMREHQEKKGNTAGSFLSWLHKDDSPIADSGTSTPIAIPDFGARWEYDSAENDYARFQNGRGARDAGGAEIRAKNVAFIFTSMKVLDELLRLEITTIGEGRALVCLDGACREGSWQKKNASARTRFYDAGGDETLFNAGPTWIEVVKNESVIEY